MAREERIHERMRGEPQRVRTAIPHRINLPPNFVLPAIRENLLLRCQEHDVLRLADRESARREPSNAPQVHPVLEHPQLPLVILQDPHAHPLPVDPNHGYGPLEIQQVDPTREPAVGRRGDLLRHGHLPPSQAPQVQHEQVDAGVGQPVQRAAGVDDLAAVHVGELLAEGGDEPGPGAGRGVEDHADEAVLGAAAEGAVEAGEDDAVLVGGGLEGEADERGLVVRLEAGEGPLAGPRERPEVPGVGVAYVVEPPVGDAGAAEDAVAGGPDPDAVGEEVEGGAGDVEGGGVDGDEAGGVQELDEEVGASGGDLVVEAEEVVVGREAEEGSGHRFEAD